MPPVPLRPTASAWRRLLTTLPVFTRGPQQPVIENGAGPWAVTLAIGAECCAASGDKFDLYYPTSLGQNGFQHPILTWDNGSNSLSANYTFSLKHMAPGGFVIIAAQDKNSGVGLTILDGANFLIAANSNPVSIFFHKLNASQMGSFGHSQGATGAINALIKSAGTIKTVLPIELPGQQFCADPLNCADTSHLTQGSIFLVDGSLRHSDFAAYAAGISHPTAIYRRVLQRRARGRHQSERYADRPNAL